MQIIVLFGFPAAGKTFVGKIFQQYFGYYLYDVQLGISRSIGTGEEGIIGIT